MDKNFDPKRIRTLLHYEQIALLNPKFKLTEEQKEYLADYRAQKAKEDKVKLEEIDSEPFQLVRETADGTVEITEADITAPIEKKKRSRRKKTAKGKAVDGTVDKEVIEEAIDHAIEVLKSEKESEE